MIIQIPEVHYDYQIEFDGIQYIPQKKGVLANPKDKSRIGEVKWTNLGFYSSIVGALKKISELHIKDTNTTLTINRYIAQYKEIVESLSDVLAVD